MKTAIALFAYNRPIHTEQTLQALRSAKGAESLPLYVFADGPRDESDKRQIAAVRALIEAAEWAGGITRKLSNRNQGLANSIVSGVTTVLDHHDAVIVLEDDIVLAEHAIEYFLNALDRYRDATGVGSVSGFAHPSRRLRIPKSYPYDAYFLTRMYSWGWATWRDRWTNVNWDIGAWIRDRQDDHLRTALKRVSPDLPHMLDLQASDRIDSWAVRFVYHHFVCGQVSVVPVFSYVQNIGMDGSGTHTGKTRREWNDLSLAKRDSLLPPFVMIDPVIQNRHRRLYTRPLRRLRSLGKLVLQRVGVGKWRRS